MSKLKVIVPLCLVVILIVIIFIGSLGFNSKKHHSSAKSIYNSESFTIEYKDFYQKIAEKDDINYLIVGDSIGKSLGTGDEEYFWSNQLSKKIKSEFGLDFVNKTEITTGGATSFDGLVDYAPTQLVHAFDLVFIVFGQNDKSAMSPEQFAINYESLIRKVKTDHPKAEIVSLIENPLDNEDEEYTKAIKKLSDYYNTILVDTRIPFNDSGLTNAQLTVDGIHPSNKGYTIYSDEIFNYLKAAIKDKKVPAKAKKKSLYTKEDFVLSTAVKYENIEGFIDTDGYKVSDNKGDYLEAKFNGSWVGFTISGTDDSGFVNVYVDNKLVNKINLYAPDGRERHIFIDNTLENKEHTLKLEVAGEEGIDYQGNPSKGTLVKISNIITKKE